MNTPEIERLREAMRTLIIPASPIDSKEEADRVRELPRVMGMLPAEERLLWGFVGESDPARLPELMLLLKVNSGTLSALLEHFADYGEPVALWPRIPPSHRLLPSVADAVTIYDVDPKEQDEVFRAWEQRENQEVIIDEINHGIDADLGQFMLSATSSVADVEQKLPRSLWSPGEFSRPVTIDEASQAMMGVTGMGQWIGKFSGAEIMWMALGGCDR